MKAIGFSQFGGPEVLKIVDLPEPQPGPGEVCIRVHAVPVNPTDITFRSGGRAAQSAERPTPYIPGMDAAGVIDKLGIDGDGRLAVGDAVIAYVIPMGPHDGAPRPPGLGFLRGTLNALDDDQPRQIRSR
ncbi:MAG TPA: alcohol dehydrogenase catalytic domain-containing protein [Acidimicrobiales bacterium]|nr:alcohol dehydrogenase catalytic domain-containing protein [Acidimicrobiales bacterium]